jgi:hypothetical protein
MRPNDGRFFVEEGPAKNSELGIDARVSAPDIGAWQKWSRGATTFNSPAGRTAAP